MQGAGVDQRTRQMFGGSRVSEMNLHSKSSQLAINLHKETI